MERQITIAIVEAPGGKVVQPFGPNVNYKDRADEFGRCAPMRPKKTLLWWSNQGP
jgi:hypothetical protein